LAEQAEQDAETHIPALQFSLVCILRKLQSANNASFISPKRTFQVIGGTALYSGSPTIEQQKSIRS
jgi:hypothetical protein